MPYRLALGWFFSAIFVVSAVHGQVPMRSSGSMPAVELAADLNTTFTPRGSGSRTWVQAGEFLYFLRFLETESELWRTDGTAGGTQLVRAVGLDFRDSTLFGGELPDGRLLFTAEDVATGEELWISDGTPAGTRLYADLCPGLCGASSNLRPREFNFRRFGNEVVFQAQTVADGPDRLLATDGGVDGVRAVSGVDIRAWAVAGDYVFIVGDTSDFPLWVNDGDPASESLVTLLDIASLRSIDALGAKVVIQAYTAGGEARLYAGDRDGVEPIANLGEVALSGHAVGSDLMFISSADRLWRSDGTVDGTFELTAVAAATGTVSRLRVAEDRAFFLVGSRQLWTSDGTEAGTLLVQNFDQDDFFSVAKLTPIGSGLAFLVRGTGDPALWLSDGSSAGTQELKSFAQVDLLSTNRMMGRLGDQLFFAADDSGIGLELWSSDGTETGTELVANLSGDAQSGNPRGMVSRSQDLAVVADHGGQAPALFSYRPGSAAELVHMAPGFFGGVVTGLGDWVIFEQRTNVQQGPTDVLAINPDSGDVVPLFTVNRVWRSTVVGDRVFLATGFAEGSAERERITAVWVTDGTPEGTIRLVSTEDGVMFNVFRFQLTAVANRIFFVAITDAAGSELWTSDGTVAGTRMVRDLDPGPASSLPDLFQVANNRLFLRAKIGPNEPLLVFGAQGTELARIQLPENLGVNTGAVAGGRLFWTQGGYRLSSTDLWVSDLDLANPSVIVTRPGIGIRAAVGDRVMFSAGHLVDDRELWLSDGTIDGTRMRGSFLAIDTPIVSGGQLFFAATTREHGNELWVSDGTVSGTHLVADIQPGPESSQPDELVAIDGGVVFSAKTAAAGREPWSTNGELGGTRQLGDISPGPRSSNPQLFTAFGDTIAFSAYRDDVGRELFAVPRAALVPACTPGETTLCLNQGRFRVAVEWRDFEGGTGPGRPVPIPVEDSGLLYFFDPDNWEMLVKVLDGCAINNRYWVFAAATTDVEYTLTVTDTSNGERVEYFNTLGNASPAITDSDAFATCP